MTKEEMASRAVFYAHDLLDAGEQAYIERSGSDYSVEGTSDQRLIRTLMRGPKAELSVCLREIRARWHTAKLNLLPANRWRKSY